MFKKIECGIATKGLGFNYLFSIKERAIKLGLKGIVFLKNDGSIKVIAEGEEKNLIKFTKKLEKEKKGFFSSVENFYVIWKESNREFKDFSINY